MVKNALRSLTKNVSYTYREKIKNTIIQNILAFVYIVIVISVSCLNGGAKNDSTQLCQIGNIQATLDIICQVIVSGSLH